MLYSFTETAKSTYMIQRLKYFVFIMKSLDKFSTHYNIKILFRLTIALIKHQPIHTCAATEKDNKYVNKYPNFLNARKMEVAQDIAYRRYWNQ